MNFKEGLNELRLEKKQLYNEINVLNNKMDAELELARKVIADKYTQLKNDVYAAISDYNEAINVFGSTIEKFSTFNTRDIGLIIASLMNFYEGINHLYQEKNKMTSIIQEENLFEANNDEIVLTMNNDSNRVISFYKLNPNTHTIEESINLGRYTYIKEFIDEVIEKRMDTNLISITYEELAKMKNEFLMSEIDSTKEKSR